MELSWRITWVFYHLAVRHFLLFVEAEALEPSSILTLLLPLASMITLPGVNSGSPAEAEPLAFGQVIRSSGRLEQLHANRLRLSDDVSLGGVFNLFDVNEDQSYTLNIRVTF